MTDCALKVLVVDAASGSEPLSVSSLGEQSLSSQAVESVTATMHTLERIDGEDIDVIMLVIGDRGQAAMEDLGEIRRRAPAVPLIVVTDHRDDDFALAALRAGAQDCLVRSEMEEDRPLLARAVRFAIERGSYLSELERSRRETVRDRDVQALQDIFAGSRVPITERSLGQMSLRERHPAEFRRLVQEYGQLLDAAVTASAPSSRQENGSEQTSLLLNAIADQLGLLGAGPRDVVELHKGALAPRIEGRDSRAARRALSYIEEGKLLVLQLMGQLVLFYRSLSWGTKPPLGSSHGRRALPGASSIGDR